MPELQIMCPKIRSIHENVEKQLVVGTRSSDIILFEEGGKNPRVLMRGHFSHELSGLVTHPKLLEMVTCGEDCLLSKWDIETKKQKF